MKLEFFIGFSVALTMLLFLTQTSMNNLAEESGIIGSTQVFNYEGSNIQAFDSGNYTIGTDYSADLPSGQGQIEPDGGNFFTDIFSTVKNWIMETTGAKYITDVLSALPSFLSRMMPSEFQAVAFAIGYLWHVLTFLSIVFWFKGGGN